MSSLEEDLIVAQKETIRLLALERDDLAARLEKALRQRDYASKDRYKLKKLYDELRADLEREGWND